MRKTETQQWAGTGRNTRSEADSLLLVLNAGSSSLKFALYEVNEGDELLVEAIGQLEGIGTLPQFVVKNAANEELLQRSFSAKEIHGHVEAFKVFSDWLREHGRNRALLAAGHRVVHGGREFFKPLLLDAKTMKRLEALVPLAPLHQPQQLAVIRALADALPSLPQVACFDTAFHHTQPTVAKTFGLPRYLTEEGVCRYGFHGLSYEYVSSVLPDLAPELSEGRIIVAHLGNGASLCALQQGRSVATTMSFTPLDGLVMGTRCGSLDPGVLLYLMDQHGMDARALEKLLYHESGLKGVSGLSSDMRVLLASDAPEAKEAIALFIYRLQREIGSLVAALGGLDALVFTGGIGERSATIRRQLCQQVTWLGVELDLNANEHHGPRISSPNSKVSLWTVRTDENLMIAKHTLKELMKAEGKGTTSEPSKTPRSNSKNTNSNAGYGSLAMLHELNQ